MKGPIATRSGRVATFGLQPSVYYVEPLARWLRHHGIDITVREDVIWVAPINSEQRSNALWIAGYFSAFVQPLPGLPAKQRDVVP